MVLFFGYFSDRRRASVDQRVEEQANRLRSDRRIRR